MKNPFTPDGYYRTVFDITPEDLKSRGITAVISDIDNTLVPYEIPEPTPEIAAWIRRLRDAGITFGLISNNNAERVALFNRSLDLFARADSGKPGTRVLKEYLSLTGKKKEETALIGDQLFTDVLCARLGGVTPLLVPPIKDKTTLFFRIKRALEKPIMRRYKKIHKIDY